MGRVPGVCRGLRISSVRHRIDPVDGKTYMDSVPRTNPYTRGPSWNRTDPSRPSPSERKGQHQLPWLRRERGSSAHLGELLSVRPGTTDVDVMPRWVIEQDTQDRADRVQAGLSIRDNQKSSRSGVE